MDSETYCIGLSAVLSVSKLNTLETIFSLPSTYLMRDKSALLLFEFFFLQDLLTEYLKFNKVLGKFSNF